MEIQKQVDRLKEEMSMKDVKLKWTQNKLKSEMDIQKETQQKLEVATVTKIYLNYFKLFIIFPYNFGFTHDHFVVIIL